MEPSEVRARVLADHGTLREELARLEALAGAVLGPRSDGAPIGSLRDESERFLSRLRTHMHWEEVHLLPVLRAADAWGCERAERLLEDHRDQRELLDFVLARLRDLARPDPIVARDVAGLVALLRDDMHEEETDLLDERVLRDDVIAIEMETG